MDLSKCTDMIKKCCTFLEEYRNTGLKSAILTAKEVTEELEIKPVFRAITRVQCVKRQNCLLKKKFINFFFNKQFFLLLIGNFIISFAFF